MATRAQIMDFVEKQCGGEAYRKDIIKFIVETNGMKYDPIRHRGYYSCAFWDRCGFVGRFHDSRQYQKRSHKIGYLLVPSYKGDSRYLHKNSSTGKYELLYACN